MRFIIIPLVIILYILWSYKSIKDLIKCYKNPYKDGTGLEESTYVWTLFNLSIIFGVLIFLTIKYW